MTTETNRLIFNKLFFDARFQSFIKLMKDNFTIDSDVVEGNLFSINYSKEYIDSFKIYFGFNGYIDDFFSKSDVFSPSFVVVNNLYKKYRDVIDFHVPRSFALGYKIYPLINRHCLYIHVKFKSESNNNFSNNNLFRKLYSDNIQIGLSHEIDCDTSDIIFDKLYFYVESENDKLSVYERFGDDRILTSPMIEHTLFYNNDIFLYDKYNLLKNDHIDINSFDNYNFMINFNSWLCNTFDVVHKTVGISNNIDKSISLYYYPKNHKSLNKIDVLSIIFNKFVNKN